MRAAALIIARDAQRRAAAWSRQVPPSIKVSVRGNTAVISSAVGPSYPNEVIRVRHPVFGMGQTGNAWSAEHRPRPPWVTNAHRPFLAPAATAKADAATARIARYIDDVCHDNGFKGG
jgi:hypothetical protein